MIADPNNEICPECGERYQTTFDCVVNGFYHDIVFVHLGFAKINFMGRTIKIPTPRFCGRYVSDKARIDVDLERKIMKVTE